MFCNVPNVKIGKTGCDFWKLGVQNTPCTPGWLMHWTDNAQVTMTCLLSHIIADSLWI